MPSNLSKGKAPAIEPDPVNSRTVTSPPLSPLTERSVSPENSFPPHEFTKAPEARQANSTVANSSLSQKPAPPTSDPAASNNANQSEAPGTPGGPGTSSEQELVWNDDMLDKMMAEEEIDKNDSLTKEQKVAKKQYVQKVEALYESLGRTEVLNKDFFPELNISYFDRIHIANCIFRAEENNVYALLELPQDATHEMAACSIKKLEMILEIPACSHEAEAKVVARAREKLATIKANLIQTVAGVANALERVRLDELKEPLVKKPRDAHRGGSTDNLEIHLGSQYSLGWSKLPPQELFTYAEDDIDKYWLPLWDHITPAAQNLWTAYLQGGNVKAALEELRTNCYKTWPEIQKLNMEKKQLLYAHGLNPEVIEMIYVRLFTAYTQGDRGNFCSRHGAINPPTIWDNDLIIRTTINSKPQHCWLGGFCLLKLPYMQTSSKWQALSMPRMCYPMPLGFRSQKLYEPGAPPTPPSTQGSPPSNSASTPQNSPSPPSNSASNPRNSPSPSQNSSPPQDTSTSGSARRRHVSVPARRVARCIRPGYTAAGEKITHAEIYGIGGRVVVETDNGGRKLLTQSEAGGRAVIDGALQCHEVGGFQSSGWKELGKRVSEMGEHGVAWVALGSWNPYNKRLPNVVCGFYHHLDGNYTEIVGSRSNLKLCLGARVAETMLAEAIAPEGSDATSVEEALEDLYEMSHDSREEYWEDHPPPVRQTRRTRQSSGETS
ncbi:hypothetical protein RJ035_005768 [Blastomyces gilchristii]